MPQDYGPWTGLGVGLGNIGQALSQRFDRQYQLREQQADKYEKQAADIAANIVQVGGPQSPEAGPLMQQLRQTVMLHNSLYKAHETPDLIQRIGRFTQKLAGRKPGPFIPTIEAPGAMTAEGMVAAAPRGQPGKEDLQQLYGQAFQMLQKAEPDKAATPEGIKELQTRAAEWVLGQRQTQSKWQAIGDARQDPDTKKWYQTFIDPTKDPSDPDAIITREMPEAFQPKGTLKAEQAKATEAEIASFSNMLDQGASWTIVPQRVRADVQAYRDRLGKGAPQPRATGALGQLVTEYMARDGLDYATALQRASKAQLDAKEAEDAMKTKASLTYDKAVALARWVIANPNMRAPLPYSRNSPDWQMYERAYADVVSGADVGNLLGARTDLRALQQAETRVATQLATTQANANNARANFEKLRQAMAAMDENSYRVAIPKLDDWLKGRQLDLTGTKEVVAFNAAFQEAMMEYARVISGQTDTGQLTNGAREAARGLLSRGLSSDAINYWIDTIGLPFMNNRENGFKQAIGGIQAQIGDLGGTIQGPPQTPPTGSNGTPTTTPTPQGLPGQPPVPPPRTPTPQDRGAAGGPPKIGGPYKGRIYNPKRGPNDQYLYNNGDWNDPRNLDSVPRSTQ